MNAFFLVVALVAAALSPLAHPGLAQTVTPVVHAAPTPPPVGTFDSVLPHP